MLLTSNGMHILIATMPYPAGLKLTSNIKIIHVGCRQLTTYMYVVDNVAADHLAPSSVCAAATILYED